MTDRAEIAIPWGWEHGADGRLSAAPEESTPMAGSAQLLPTGTRSRFSWRLFWTRVLAVGVFLCAFSVSRQIFEEKRTELPPPNSAQKAAIHEKLRAIRARDVAQLPRRVDDITALVDLRAEGTTLVHVFTVSGHTSLNLDGVKARIRQQACDGPTKAAILAGTSFAYEYWSPAPEQKLLGRFQIETCPFNF
jgi:hypothetical protein